MSDEDRPTGRDLIRLPAMGLQSQSDDLARRGLQLLEGSSDTLWAYSVDAWAVTFVDEEDENPRDYRPIYAAYTALPIDKVITFRSRSPNHNSIEIYLLSGETVLDPGEIHKPFGCIGIEGLSRQPNGHFEVEVTFCFCLDEDDKCIIRVNASDPVTHAKLDIALKPPPLPEWQDFDGTEDEGSG